MARKSRNPTVASLYGLNKSIEALSVDVASLEPVRLSVGSLAFSLIVVVREAIIARKKQTMARKSRNPTVASLYGLNKSIEALSVDVASLESVRLSVGSLAFSFIVVDREAIIARKK
jgi:predicted protein tyrosine phosphatase